MSEQDRNCRKYLKQLTRAVKSAISLIDGEMKKPSDFQRGRRIARITNALEMQNDAARHFGLGEKL